MAPPSLKKLNTFLFEEMNIGKLDSKVSGWVGIPKK